MQTDPTAEPSELAEPSQAEAAPVETVTSVKGFRSDWTCQPDEDKPPFHFEVGETYEHEGEVRPAADSLLSLRRWRTAMLRERGTSLHRSSAREYRLARLVAIGVRP